ncbi:glycosyltransferase family 2 protein [Candidatus Electrothrix sp.]|uniref:glycosyltransferase family 2 protein n=1 Tax=Candidatus Electrothrix sp. TaxID=2170559 RepID=UPI0040565B11
MFNAPLISIVTPSFNQGQWLDYAMCSLLDQEYPNLEYIVIDGGSADESKDVIRRHASRLAYWCSEQDKGQYDAVEKGFRHSTGEIMAWLNADDMYFPWTLQVVGEVFALFPEVEWLISLNPGSFNERGVLSGSNARMGYCKDLFKRGFYLRLDSNSAGRFIQQESVFWRRSLWERSGAHLSRRYELAGDFELWARFFQHAQPWGIKAMLAGFRRHSEQRSQQQRTQYLAEVFKILSEYGGTVEPRWISMLRKNSIVQRFPFAEQLGLSFKAANIKWSAEEKTWVQQRRYICQ